MYLLFRLRELIARFNAGVYRGVKSPIRRLRDQFGMVSKSMKRAGTRRRQRSAAKKKSRSEARQRKRQGLKPRKPRRVPIRDRTATFDVAARSVLLMAFGGVLLAVLLFSAGFLTGLRWKAAPAEPAGGEGGPAPAGAAPAGAPLAATGPVAPAASPAVGADSGPLPAPSAAAAVPSLQSAPAVSPPAAQVAQQLAPPPAFTLGVGSFLLEEDAQLFLQMLTGRGYQPTVEKLRGVGEKQVFR
ncbi:MAG: hypothetical protein KDD47_20080, partial [Acidobacteria bacterium]|nr:hypothetical protein [Acidobacteriota bacterium]